MINMRSFLALCLLLTFVSCEQAVQEEAVLEAQVQKVEGQKDCSASNAQIPDQLRSPDSINEVVDLINALPRPLTLPCFVSSLARPLNIYPTDSARSAQPARGERSPRVFLMRAPLVMSIAMEGVAAHSLEISEFTSAQKSIKAEIKFPINQGDITLASVFEKVDIEGNESSCAGCHEGEQKIDHLIYPGPIYENFAIKPTEDQKLSVEDFRGEFFLCDLQPEQGHRCDMITSIFNYGEVKFKDFPDETPTFFESLAL